MGQEVRAWPIGYSRRSQYSKKGRGRCCSMYAFFCSAKTLSFCFNRLIINHSLESGTQLPYIARAKQVGLTVLCHSLFPPHPLKAFANTAGLLCRRGMESLS